jgi:hypothetical protein
VVNAAPAKKTVMPKSAIISGSSGGSKRCVNFNKRKINETVTNNLPL